MGSGPWGTAHPIRTVMERVVFLYDGFNLYHAIKDLGRPDLKWVNLMALSRALIQSRSQRIAGVYYCSAFATWLPEQHTRHRAYVDALKNAGVVPMMGRFKEKMDRCEKCRELVRHHSEKESDVNLALLMVDLGYRDEYDAVYLVTQDSDLAPAVRLVTSTFTQKRVVIVTPPARRRSEELSEKAHETKTIQLSQLERSRVPAVIQNQKGEIVVRRPIEYAPRQ